MRCVRIFKDDLMKQCSNEATAIDDGLSLCDECYELKRQIVKDSILRHMELYKKLEELKKFRWWNPKTW